MTRRSKKVTRRSAPLAIVLGGTKLRTIQRSFIAVIDMKLRELHARAEHRKRNEPPLYIANMEDSLHKWREGLALDISGKGGPVRRIADDTVIAATAAAANSVVAMPALDGRPKRASLAHRWMRRVNASLA